MKPEDAGYTKRLPSKRKDMRTGTIQDKRRVSAKGYRKSKQK
jgi:hypothetical protein